MRYQTHHISKDLLQWMPVAAFEGEVVVVDQPDQVADAIAYLRTQKIVGVDTEARPSFQSKSWPISSLTKRYAR